MDISKLRVGIMVEGVGVIGERDEETKVGMGAYVLGEGIVEMEGISSCGIKECEDVGVIRSVDEVERMGEVEEGI